MIFLSFGAVAALLASDAGVDAFLTPAPRSIAGSQTRPTATAAFRRRSEHASHRLSGRSSLRAFWGGNKNNDNDDIDNNDQYYYDDMPQQQAYGSEYYGGGVGVDPYKSVVGEHVSVSPDCGNLLDPYGGGSSQMNYYGKTQHIADAYSSMTDDSTATRSLSGVAQSLADAANNAADAVAAAADSAARSLSGRAAAATAGAAAVVPSMLPQRVNAFDGMPLVTPGDTLMGSDLAAAAAQPMQSQARVLADSGGSLPPSLNAGMNSNALMTSSPPVPYMPDGGSTNNAFANSGNALMSSSPVQPITDGTAANAFANSAPLNPPPAATGMLDSTARSMPQSARIMADAGGPPSSSIQDRVNALTDSMMQGGSSTGGAPTVPEQARLLAESSSSPQSMPDSVAQAQSTAAQSILDRENAFTDAAPTLNSPNAAMESVARTMPEERANALQERMDALTDSIMAQAQQGSQSPSALSAHAQSVVPEQARMAAEGMNSGTAVTDSVAQAQSTAAQSILDRESAFTGAAAPLDAPPSSLAESVAQAMPERANAFADSTPLNSPPSAAMDSAAATGQSMREKVDALTDSMMQSGGQSLRQGANAAAESAATASPLNAATEPLAAPSMPEGLNAPVESANSLADSAAAQSMPDATTSLSDSTTAAADTLAKSLPATTPPATPDALVDSAAKSLAEATNSPPPVPDAKTLWDSVGNAFENTAAPKSSPLAEKAHSLLDSPAVKSVSGKASSALDSATKSVSGKASSAFDSAAKSLSNKASALADSAAKSLSEVASSAGKAASHKAESAVGAVSDKAHVLSESAAKSFSTATHSASDAAFHTLSTAGHGATDAAGRFLAEAFPPVELVDGVAPTFVTYMQARAPAVIDFLKEKGPPAAEAVKSIAAAAVDEIKTLSAASEPLSKESFTQGVQNIPAFPTDTFAQVVQDLVRVFQTGGGFDDLIHALNVPALGSWYALPLGGVLVITAINNSIIEASYKKKPQPKSASTVQKKWGAAAVPPAAVGTVRAAPKEDAVQSLAAEVRNLRADTETTKDDYSNLAAELESMRAQLERGVAVERKLRAELEEKDKRLEAELAKTKTSSGSKATEEKLIDQLMDANIKLKATKNGMEHIFREEKELKATLKKTNAQLETKRSEIEKSLGVEKELRAKLSEAESRLTNTKSELERRYEEKLRDELMDAKIKMKATKNGMEDVFRSEKKLKAELMKTNKQLETKTSEIEQKLVVEQELRAKLSETEKQLETTKSQLEQGPTGGKDLKVKLSNTSLQPKSGGTGAPTQFFVKSEAPEQKIRAKDFKAAVMDAENRDRNKSGEEVIDGMLEPLAASFLSDKNDPTRLTWEVVEAGWGTWTEFMLAHGLKPSREADLKEALGISRRLKGIKSKKTLF